MSYQKIAAFIIVLFSSGSPLLAQSAQDVFTINIQKDGDGGLDEISSPEVKSEDPATVEGAGPVAQGEDAALPESDPDLTEGGTTGEGDLQLGVVVEEDESGSGVSVESVESAGLGEEDLVVPEEGPLTGDVGGQDGWTTVSIPQIKGSISIPNGWHQPTSQELVQSLDLVDFPDDGDRAAAEMGALSIGRVSFLVTKNPEPTENLNPGVSVSWSPIPMAFVQIPLEARSEALARVLSTEIIPEMKSTDKGFQLLEGPKTINDEGAGAWVTFRSTTPLKSGKTNEGIVRLYVLPAKDHLITAIISAPADREKGEEILPDLWAIFESLTFLK